jgi:hypothetical protein
VCKQGLWAEKACNYTGIASIGACKDRGQTVPISTVAKRKNGNCRHCKAKKEKKDKDKEKGRKVGAETKVYSGKMLYCSLS